MMLGRLIPLRFIKWPLESHLMPPRILCLLQLHSPIRVIQKLLPAPVTLIGQADVDHRTALGLDRLGDQVHVGLLRGSAALFYVALDAAADDVGPGAFSALALGEDMIERKLGRGV